MAGAMETATRWPAICTSSKRRMEAFLTARVCVSENFGSESKKSRVREWSGFLLCQPLNKLNCKSVGAGSEGSGTEVRLRFLLMACADRLGTRGHAHEAKPRRAHGFPTTGGGGCRGHPAADLEPSSRGWELIFAAGTPICPQAAGGSQRGDHRSGKCPPRFPVGIPCQIPSIQANTLLAR